MKNIDYEYTREIVCPYCGYMQGDSWEWNMNEADDWDECECDNCGKIFFAVRNIDVSYSSAKNPGGVIMAQHEPTTEEIVNALRTCEDQDCDSYEYGNKYACEYLIRVHAADRLEQLQRERTMTND